MYCLIGVVSNCGIVYHTRMALPQIVIDTNVFISGLRSRRGASFRLLSLIGTENFDIHISVPLILEYQDVLLRQLPSFNLSSDDIDDFLNYLCLVGKSHQIFYLWRPTLRDPQDEMLLELAVKAQCDSIITFNHKDFHGIEQFGLITQTPQQFLIDIGEL